MKNTATSTSTIIIGSLLTLGGVIYVALGCLLKGVEWAHRDTKIVKDGGEIDEN